MGKGVVLFARVIQARLGVSNEGERYLDDECKFTARSQRDVILSDGDEYQEAEHQLICYEVRLVA